MAAWSLVMPSPTLPSGPGKGSNEEILPNDVIVQEQPFYITLRQGGGPLYNAVGAVRIIKRQLKYLNGDPFSIDGQNLQANGTDVDLTITCHRPTVVRYWALAASCADALGKDIYGNTQFRVSVIRIARSYQAGGAPIPGLGVAPPPGFLDIAGSFYSQAAGSVVKNVSGTLDAVKKALPSPTKVVLWVAGGLLAVIFVASFAKGLGGR
jgi:hypothetical protein